MKYLYIDTSSNFLYSAIIENDSVISKICEEFGQELSEKALPSIVEMFEKSDITPKEIDKIIVVNGPGSFTGIRIGITIAKIFSWSLKIDITTITSLEAMAVSNKNNIIKIPIIDARRGYVYGAIFDENNNIIIKPQHIKLDELKEYAKKYDNYLYISNDKFEDANNIINYEPDFLSIINKYKDKECINPHSVNPDYLKLTAAEESKNDNKD